MTVLISCIANSY